VKIGLQRRNQLQGSGPAGQAALEEFQSLVSALAGWSRREHTDEGLHTNLTAQSVEIASIRNTALKVVSGLTDLGGGLAAHGAITPDTLTADVDNFSPPGIDGAFCVRVQTDASRVMTGIQDGPRIVPVSGRLLLLFNAGSNNLVLEHEGLTSTAEFRFRLSGFANVTVEPNNCVLLYYDARARRWILVASSGGGAGSIYSEFDAGDSGASITIDWASGTQQILTLTANAALSFSNPVEGAEYRLVLVQDGSGGRVPTFAANVFIDNTALPALKTQPGDLVLLTLAYTAAGGGKYVASYSDVEFAAGDVVGPGTTVDKEIALFDGTTGKLLERATGTGIVRVASGVYGTPGNVVESEITLADNTTNNALTTAHGFLKKLSNVSTEYMDGTGNWSTPAGGGGGLNMGFTPPVLANFTNINTIVATSGTVWGDTAITVTAAATGSINVRALVKAAPATPYTVTIAILPMFINAQYVVMGPVFRQSSDGKLIQFGMGYESGANLPWEVLGYRMTSPTVYASQFTTLDITAPISPLWMRIADNGTNRIFSMSPDGVTFLPVFTEGRTSFLTANQVGFGFYQQSASVVPLYSVLSYAEA